MKWNKYTIETTVSAEDYICGILADFGISGAEIKDAAPLDKSDMSKMFMDFPAELPPDDGRGYIIFYLEPGNENDKLIERVNAELKSISDFIDIGSGMISMSVVDDSDWIDNWKKFFHSFAIGDIVIKPTWEQLEPEYEGKTVIEIDPGMSFGTGKHETTRLCIEQLNRFLHAGDNVLDIGCGSGILSIVSLKIGAGHVTGTDVDENCMISVSENFEVNGIPAGRGNFFVGDLTCDAGLQKKVGSDKYDIAVANILADTIIPMLPAIKNTLKPGGIFIGSGIIDFKKDEVINAVKEAGMDILDVTGLKEWIAIVAKNDDI